MSSVSGWPVPATDRLAGATVASDPTRTRPTREIQMAWYLVEITYDLEKMPEVRPRHREFLTGLAANGDVAFAGPHGDGTGGITLYQAEDEAALVEIIDPVPYHLGGAAVTRPVREFKPVVG